MSKLDILKSLAPGFLPLIVFIVADSIWGTKIGLYVAISVGIVEFIISYIKEKIIDKFILLDIGLIVILGMVSILLENEIFFKLKPAFIELIFCAILGISIFSPVNVMLVLSKRYLKNVELSETHIRQFTKSLFALFFIFLGHTVLIVYSAFFMSKGAWAFISGGLFYILFFIYFGFEFIKNRRKQKKWVEKYKDEEWFDIVDESGKVTGRAPRSVCHSGPGILHAVIHIHIINKKNRIFLQKRSQKKKIQPGKWDTAIGGHLSSGENLEECIKREAFEELGIREFKVQFISKYVWETDVESELVFMLVSQYDKDITINKEELDDGKFWKIKKLKESVSKGILTPNFEHEFKILLTKFFKEN